MSVTLQSNVQLLSMFSQSLQLQGNVTPRDALAAQQLIQNFGSLFGDNAYSAAGMQQQNFSQYMSPQQNFFQNMMPAPMGFDPSMLMNAMSMLQGGNLFGSKGFGNTGIAGGYNPRQMGGFQDFGGGIQGMGIQMQMLMMRMDIGGVQASNVRTKPPVDDPFAVHQQCRTGLDNPSRMTDQTLLVVNDILQKHSTTTRGEFKAMTFEEMQQAVFERTGEKPEIAMVKTKSGDEIKALKFKDGSVVADGAGDGKIDTGDYNFKGAIADLQKRLGVDDAGVDKLAQGIYDSHTNEAKFQESINTAFPGFKDLPADIQQLGMQMLGHKSPQPGDDVLSGLVNDMKGGAGNYSQVSIFMLSMQAYSFAGGGGGGGFGGGNGFFN